MPISDLSEALLKTLYLDEGFTDSEIAERFETYQVKISRLRNQWGIETQSKSERLALPALTPRQRSLLVGSMFGDGRLLRTGGRTAGYSEYHSLEQAEYLSWKAEEWGPYVKSVRPVTKVSRGKTYHGQLLRLHGCSTFYPYWRRYYPTGNGNKTFVDVGSGLTALALAIWYLDDGSKTSNGYVRFSVSPLDSDQKVLLEVLSRFGLTPKLYVTPDGSDVSIWLHDRTSLTKFLDLVTPHVPECMAYKLDLKLRERGPAPRHVLTSDLLKGFTAQGWGAGRIAEALNMSVGSVRRAMDRHGFSRPKAGRPTQGSHITFDEVRDLIRTTELSEDALIELLVSTPHPDGPTRDAAERDWQSLVRLTQTIPEAVGNQGSKLCTFYFPYRFDARYESLPSLRQAWYDPKWLRRAVKFQKRVGDPLLPMNVHRALRAVLRTPTNFRPALAKAIVGAYSQPGDLVLDPCAGYGGRVTGTLAAGRRYVGVDPHPEARTAFNDLKASIGDFVFYNSPFESIDLGGLQADLVFTSPPYFSKERYSDSTDQSWVSYPTWTGWLKGFLKPFIEKSWCHLKPGGYFLVNTKNIRIGRTTYPIADELIGMALQTGFLKEDEVPLQLGRLGKTSSVEPLFVFRKPV